MSPAGPRTTRQELQAQEPGGGQDEELWAAVAEPSRRLLLDVLLAHGEATPTTLAAELPFTRQAVSKHLAVLTRAGLVEGRRDGREVRYAVRPDRLDAAAQVMAQVAERWDMRLQAIKRLAETAARSAPADSPPSAPPATAARPTVGYTMNAEA